MSASIQGWRRLLRLKEVLLTNFTLEIPLYLCVKEFSISFLFLISPDLNAAPSTMTCYGGLWKVSICTISLVPPQRGEGLVDRKIRTKNLELECMRRRVLLRHKICILDKCLTSYAPILSSSTLWTKNFDQWIFLEGSTSNAKTIRKFAMQY